MGKKIILNESAFRRIIRKALNENLYDDQWEDEIKMFMNGIHNDTAIADNGIIYVEYEHGEDDGYDERYPRYIYYKSGDYCLSDDEFCVQHSRKLTYGEMFAIMGFAERHGLDIEFPEEYYEEEYDERYDY